MTDDAEPLKRLAAYVERRIAELALEYTEAARLAGFSIEVLRKIRNGVGVRANTYRKLERALEWKQGSIAEILAGGEPTPIQESAGGQPGPGDPTLDQELELAARLMAAQVRELGLSPEDAAEAWRRAQERVAQSHEAPSRPDSRPGAPSHHRAG